MEIVHDGREKERITVEKIKVETNSTEEDSKESKGGNRLERTMMKVKRRLTQEWRMVYDERDKCSESKGGS